MTRSEVLREEYRSRINRVLDYIEGHISEELSLEKLAEVANFSPFHFHRLFKALMSESLWQFIRRVRIERSAATLINNPRLSVADVAYDSGFSGPSAFAKAFSEIMGMAPTEWREKYSSAQGNSDKSNSKNGQANGNIEKDMAAHSPYFAVVRYSDFKNNIWSIEMNSTNLQARITVSDVPDMNIAYVRHVGAYQNRPELFESLFGRLFQWAGPRGYLRFSATKLVTVYHDNPDITEEDKLRISVGITVDETVKPEGEIGQMLLPGGKYAIAEFEINPDQYGEAWNAVYGGWLPGSGYQPDDRPCFEVYLNDPKQHPEGKHVVAIYAPIKPL
jgi:AraC family transcriptional regulator